MGISQQTECAVRLIEVDKLRRRTVAFATARIAFATGCWLASMEQPDTGRLDAGRASKGIPAKE